MNSPVVLDAMILIYLTQVRRRGLTLARCRGWRFVTTDKRALQFAAKFMGDITVLHLSDLLDEVVAAGGLSREEVAAFFINAMPGYRN